MNTCEIYIAVELDIWVLQALVHNSRFFPALFLIKEGVWGSAKKNEKEGVGKQGLGGGV